MFRKLHLQLTTLCVAITALVLAVLSCICLYISESVIRAQEHSAFLASLDTMYRNLEQQVSLSHTWVRQMEHNHQFFLRITDNGTPLFFQELEKETIPEELWSAAQAKALETYGIDLQDPGTLSVLTRYEEFSLSYDGTHYNASVGLIPRDNGYIGVTVLQPLERMETRILRQRLAFLAADLAALALLGVFFWYFTKRMLRPLIENRKKQMQFVASASHELRSPLTVILSNVAAVRSGAMKGDSRFLHVIDSEGNRMSRLITDMLQLAGADNHSWSVNLSEVEPDTLLLQVWEQFEPVAISRGLRWEISLPDAPVPRCVCDEERIRQLLSILIENAFAYTPSGGLVRLALSVDHSSERVGQRNSAFLPLNDRSLRAELPAGQQAAPDERSCSRQMITGSAKPKYKKRVGRPAHHDCLCIAVIDNGPGIPDDQKTAVFERFHRLDRSRTDKSHFGLGLCIAQEIARLHHGRIILTDTPGGGATFTVLLPFSTL